MSKKRLILLGLVALLVAIYFLSAPEKKGADSAELKAFKAFLRDPGPIGKIAFAQTTKGAPTRYEGVLPKEGHRVTIIYGNGKSSESGVFGGKPWVHQSSGLEVVQTYHEWPLETKRMRDELGGVSVGESKMFEALSMGIFNLKPGSLVWEGDKFRGIVSGRFPMKGEISKFNKKGLPQKLAYEFGGVRATVELEYAGTNLPSFFSERHAEKASVVPGSNGPDYSYGGE